MLDWQQHIWNVNADKLRWFVLNMPQLMGPMIQLKWIRISKWTKIHGNDLIICYVWVSSPGPPNNFLIRIIWVVDGGKFYRFGLFFFCGITTHINSKWWMEFRANFKIFVVEKPRCLVIVLPCMALKANLFWTIIQCFKFVFYKFRTLFV